ncbi:uncharacterized protein MYCFIDRAFT_80917 [Pseudocercospora fijiensis CIRAD86]|uniref:Uncharacterized protein n=1 Tax=Pseudocercospora fijiensis (strain CIRAD86) TaxID=383855 RepID=M3AMZ5_PSEFD|nr:uncharacterized protein MYCFIDRAFT_80917 [Pseudocercospora fijiensis CIRAD86]EME78503.1 hypothetical protein MYCFIDRAFT_80917 [Pseudocercospora fijiensis CIRAD86]
MPTGPLDYLEHGFAFNSIEEARNDVNSSYNLSPPDDDYLEICGEENHKALVYDLWHAIMRHAKRDVKEESRSPAPVNIDPAAWRAFQTDQDQNLGKIVGKDENGEVEAERRCWVMLDQILEVHRTGARKSNFFGPAEKWVLKFSERLERVVKAIENHSIIAIDVLRGHNLPEIAIMTDAFVEKRVGLQLGIFMGERENGNGG